MYSSQSTKDNEARTLSRILSSRLRDPPFTIPFLQCATSSSGVRASQSDALDSYRESKNKESLFKVFRPTFSDVSKINEKKRIGCPKETFVEPWLKKFTAGFDKKEFAET